MAKNQDYELYSFDIFDTLITRTTFDPTGIFLLIQNELLFNKDFSDIPDFVKKNFRILRIGAESFLRRTKLYKRLDRILSPTEAQQEFSLEEFYALMGSQHNLSKEQQQKLINLEIETEIKNSVPIKENIELVKELVSKGSRVILISDMYLKADVIRKILTKHDPVFNDIKIYVSSEYQEFKSTGKLYHLVAKEEGIEDYSKWIHIGDNEKSDIKMAQKLKINTKYYKKTEKTEFEENFYTAPLLATSSEAQIMLASSIQTRQFLKDNPMADFATLATTVLFPYVKWVINESLNKGINRLYFIARDGYVLKEIADVIIEQEKIENLKTHYIYGSRQAWRLPCAQTTDEIFVVFLQYTSKISIEHLAISFGLKPEEILKFLPDLRKIKKEFLTDSELITVQNILKNNQEFKELILERNKQKQDLLVEYLRQNIDFSDDKFAFVDLTTSGFTSVLLGNLIKNKFNQISKNFVISLGRDLQEKENAKIYHYTELYYSDEIIEMFARAPHGLTKGYKENDGKVVPILDSSETIKNFSEYVFAIKLQSKLLTNATYKNNLCLDSLSYAFIDFLKTDYTKDIAKYFAKIPFSTFGTMEKYSINKSKLSVFDVINIFYFKKTAPSEKAVDFAVKNSNVFVRLLAFFFKTFSKFNHQKIKQNFKHTLILIRNKFD